MTERALACWYFIQVVSYAEGTKMMVQSFIKQEWEKLLVKYDSIMEEDLEKCQERLLLYIKHCMNDTPETEQDSDSCGDREFERLFKGDRVLYKGYLHQEPVSIEATIVKVYYDTKGCYYLVRFDNGFEKQTVRTNLAKIVECCHTQ